MKFNKIFACILPIAAVAQAHSDFWTRGVDSEYELTLGARDIENIEDILTARGLDLEDLYDHLALLPRLDRPNKPSFPPGYFATLPPSKPHSGLPHHGWDSPTPPPKPGPGSNGYFDGGSKSGGSRPGPPRRSSFRRRDVEDLELAYWGLV